MLALMLASPSFATIVTKMDLPALVQSSDVIVQGTVEQVYSQVDPQLNLIFTYASIRVDEAIKGGPRQTILIRQLGGTVGGLSLNIAGSPDFKQGEQVVVFLETQHNGAFHVAGLNQGRYTIEDNVAVANTSGLTLLDAKTKQMNDRTVINRTPLVEFKSKIRELIR